MADFINEHRRRNLLTQTDLAKKAGVSIGTITRLEAGKIGQMKVETLLSVLNALNIKPSSFFKQYD